MALLNTNIGPERVQVFPRPLGTVQVPGAATSVTAFLISTTMTGAPVNTPTRVTDLDGFVDAFGGPDEVNHGAYYAVKGYYDNAGTGAVAIIVNVGSSATATDFIGNAADNSGLRALDAQDSLGLVCVPGLPLETAYLVQPALIDYTEVVRAEFGATLSTSFSLLGMPGEINRANANTTIATTQYDSVTGSGPYVIAIQGTTGVAATGTVTISDFAALLDASSQDTLEIAGVVFTAQSGAATLGDATFQAATDEATTAASLVAQINANSTAAALVSASNVGAVVTITAVAPGAAGNSLTLAYTNVGGSVGASVSGATLAGGVDDSVDLSAVTPGMLVTDSAGSVQLVISAVDDVANTITVNTDPSSTFSSGDDLLVQMPSAVTYKESIINNPSRAAAWYFNRPVVLDEASTAAAGATLAVDSVGHVAGTIARIDANTAVGGVSHAPAGIQYAGLAGIVGLSLSLSERIDAEPLRLNFINRITSFPGAGNVIFGGYTADSGTSPTFTADDQLIQVIRSAQFIKASLEPGLRGFIWENFSPETQSQVERAISSFLRNNSYLFPAGLPEAQQFRVLRVEATQDELDQGLLRVRVQIRPNKAVRFIEVALEYPLPSNA